MSGGVFRSLLARAGGHGGDLAAEGIPTVWGRAEEGERETTETAEEKYFPIGDGRGVWGKKAGRKPEASGRRLSPGGEREEREGTRKKGILKFFNPQSEWGLEQRSKGGGENKEKRGSLKRRREEREWRGPKGRENSR